MRIALQLHSWTLLSVRMDGPVRLPIRGLRDERGSASIRVKPFWRTRSWMDRRRGGRLIQAQQWSCIIACDVHFVGEDLLSPRPSSLLKIDGALRYSRAVCSSPRNHMTLFPVTHEDEIANTGPAVYLLDIFSVCEDTMSRSDR